MKESGRSGGVHAGAEGTVREVFGVAGCMVRADFDDFRGAHGNCHTKDLDVLAPGPPAPSPPHVPPPSPSAPAPYAPPVVATARERLVDDAFERARSAPPPPPPPLPDARIGRRVMCRSGQLGSTFVAEGVIVVVDGALMLVRFPGGAERYFSNAELELLP